MTLSPERFNMRQRAKDAERAARKAEYTDTTFIRQLIDTYQGTCYPLNRTSIRALLDEIERLRATLTRLVELGDDDGSAPTSAWKDAFNAARVLIQ